MKLLIISPGYLTMPAVNGGAIEGLIDTITEENEIYKKATFIIYSISDGNKIPINNKKNTVYKYININSKKYKLKRLFLALINKIPNVYVGKAYIREVIKMIKKENEEFDAIIVENNPIFAIPLRKKFKCPIILHLHNDYLTNTSKLATKTLNSLTQILTVSNYIGNRIKTIDPKTTKVKTLYNGIDLQKFNKNITKNEKEEFLKKYNIDSNQKVILYTGRIMPEKGVKELITAFLNVKMTHNNLKLLIVGSSFFKNAKLTPYQQELKKMCAGHESDIIFTGYIDHDKIVNVYKSCDIQVVPSIWGEPLATTVIEGMASGIPLIVNNVGGIPEMVDKECALFCETKTLINDIEKNINLLLEDKNNLRKKLTINSLSKVKTFEKSIFYSNYIDNIENIIKTKDVYNG